MGHGNGIPGNIQESEHFMSPEASAVILLLLCVMVIIVIILSIIIYKKSQIIKRQQEFLKSTLTEREQKLINDYRNLNNHGKTIIEAECKELTDNDKTRKEEDDGV